MKILSYLGAEGECIVIETENDLYPLLDFVQTKMVDLGTDESMNCASFISKLMSMTEKFGYGSIDDVDNVEYS